MDEQAQRCRSVARAAVVRIKVDEELKLVRARRRDPLATASPCRAREHPRSESTFGLAADGLAVNSPMQLVSRRGTAVPFTDDPRPLERDRHDLAGPNNARFGGFGPPRIDTQALPGLNARNAVRPADAYLAPASLSRTILGGAMAPSGGQNLLFGCSIASAARPQPVRGSRRTRRRRPPKRGEQECEERGASYS